MPPRNPSELARLTDELEEWRFKAFCLRFPKSTRELALREVRKLEEQLGIESKNYNG